MRGIKYTKSTIRDQLIIQKHFTSKIDSDWLLMSNQQIFKMADLRKPLNFISVDLLIFDTHILIAPRLLICHLLTRDINRYLGLASLYLWSILPL
jgi:hypothetical protein